MCTMNSDKMKTLGRDRLLKVVSQLGQVFSTSDVAEVLDFDNALASMLLSKWRNQKWVAKDQKRAIYDGLPG